jgi:hypothetical protein
MSLDKHVQSSFRVFTSIDASCSCDFRPVNEDRIVRSTRSPSWILQRLDGYSDKRWPHRLFDVRPVDQDRYLARISPNPSDRRRFLINIFYQRRLYGRHPLPTENDALALTQAWNQFLVNLEHKGLERWLKLHSDARDKFETYSPYGACMRVHRWSRKGGLPCMVWADNCSQCHPAAQRVRPVRDGWVNRVSPRLAQAISDHERLVANREGTAARGWASSYWATRPGASSRRFSHGSQLSADGG